MNDDHNPPSPALTLSPIVSRARDWPEGHAMELAQKGSYEELRSAIIRGCPVDEPNANQTTALHVAALHGHLACVELLLASGVRAGGLDAAGLTPAMLAERGGHKECAILLQSAEGPVDRPEPTDD